MTSETRRCDWCHELLEPATRRDARFCGKRCRQAAFRLRQRSGVGHASTTDRTGVPQRRVARDVVGDGSARFAYADPPYPGRARKYYGNEPTFAGEVDHAELIASLAAAEYDGWALSTAADALASILPLCPAGARVCAWLKPIGACTLTNGLHNCWEPLIVVGGRQRRPGVRDWIVAQPARGGGSLPGRKPIAFCAWLFDCLGMQSGDELDDLFPGTGIVSRAWAELSSGTVVPSDASPSAAAPSDASSEYSGMRRWVRDVAEDLSDTSRGPDSQLSLAPGDPSPGAAERRAAA